MRVALFDVDGTLVVTGGAGLRALDRAFVRVMGLPEAMAGVRCAGKTDPAIIREVCEARIGRGPTAQESADIASAYLSFLEEELAEREGYRVLAGVHEVLASLSGVHGLFIGLGTGNFEAGARLKLEPAGLNGHFSFGGFGSDAEQRADVLRAGVRRAESLAGKSAEPGRVAVIGDTVLDVRAGKAIGAVTVAVPFDEEDRADILAEGADVVLDSLAGVLAWFERWNDGALLDTRPKNR